MQPVPRRSTVLLLLCLAALSVVGSARAERATTPDLLAAYDLAEHALQGRYDLDPRYDRLEITRSGRQWTFNYDPLPDENGRVIVGGDASVRVRDDGSVNVFFGL